MNKHYTLLLLALLLTNSCNFSSQVSTIPVDNSTTWNTQEFLDKQKAWDSTVTYLELHPEQAIVDSEKVLLEDVFFQSLDGRNPSPDYLRSYKYASEMVRYGIDSSNEFHSWHMMLSAYARKQAAVDIVTDSASNSAEEIATLEQKNKELRNSLSYYKNEIRVLKDSVEAQKDVIDRLKKLELLLEKERQRFQ